MKIQKVIETKQKKKLEETFTYIKYTSERVRYTKRNQRERYIISKKERLIERY